MIGILTHYTVFDVIKVIQYFTVSVIIQFQVEIQDFVRLKHQCLGFTFRYKEFAQDCINVLVFRSQRYQFNPIFEAKLKVIDRKRKFL